MKVGKGELLLLSIAVASGLWLFLQVYWNMAILEHSAMSGLVFGLIILLFAILFTTLIISFFPSNAK